MENLIELGFAQAGTGDALTAHAETAMRLIVGFPESITDEARADLYAGYRKRWDAKHPPVVFAMIDGNYIEATPDMVKNKKIEKVEIGMHHVFSYTQQEFGKLKTSQPALYAVMLPIREKVGDYCSGALSDLRNKAKKLMRKNNPTPRAPNLDFIEWLTDKDKGVLSTMKDRCKTAKRRGDASANEAMLAEAINAFMSKYKP